MPLPSSLQSAIDQLIASSSTQQLLEAREELTQRYRHPLGSRFMTTDQQRQAYVVARLPATYAALQATLAAVKERADLPIKTVLDLGAGPGTAMWAACEHFPQIEKVTLIEKDHSLAVIGQHLAKASEHASIRSALWLQADLAHLQDLPVHDLTVLSYSVGELKPEKVIPLIHLCWKATQQLLLIVEPGTPMGFERIRLIRHHLLAEGAHLIAPCPHQEACPLGGGDWCHFSARLARSSLHRRLKGGHLGYEDEKFAYLAVARTAFPLAASRILSQPKRHSGHVMLKLCTNQGIQQAIISKRRGALYKQACRVDWGESFPIA